MGGLMCTYLVMIFLARVTFLTRLAAAAAVLPPATYTHTHKKLNIVHNLRCLEI